ncbi:MAG: hypothetical protein QM780_13610 [Hyphomicrobium sp.]|uniref:hypothetical protein n=1 Tax=Hyphomicrobium sp. TaxID=82 RepID=UPI0039E39FA0
MRDYEAELKAAFEDGHRQGQAEGRAEAEADAEILLNEAGVRHAEELATEKQSWEEAFADVLIARLDSAAKSIGHSIEARVASLLKPWLTDRLRGRALEDLERAISRAMSEGAKIHIEAPAEIVQHLRERLPTDALQIGYSESSSADVRAHIEDTVIEVNISAWIAELETAAI